jgi:hypothetical protein
LAQALAYLVLLLVVVEVVLDVLVEMAVVEMLVLTHKAKQELQILEVVAAAHTMPVLVVLVVLGLL